MAGDATPYASPYLPWRWAITPLDIKAAHCPSTHHVVIIYMIATVLTTIFGLLVGSRYVPYWLTGTRFGKKGSKAWKYLWVLQLALHLGADFVVAYLLTRTTPNYNESLLPSVFNLALFYTSRPRMAWIALGAVGIWSEHFKSTAIQTMISEAIMQLLGCYYLGRTANFATNEGYFVQHGYNHWAQLMYGSALFTLIMTAISIFGLLAALHILIRTEKKTGCLTSTCTKALWIFLMIACGAAAFTGRWLFLIGYLKVAKEIYCPPKLAEAAVVWISMNVFGIFIGVFAG